MTRTTHDRTSGRSIRDRRTDRRACGYERDGLASVLLLAQLRALNALQPRPGERILDVGCATGAAVRDMAAGGAVTVGVDRSPAMITHAHERARSVGGARFVVSDAEHLPFRSTTFTAVLCTSVLHYLDRTDTVLAEIYRVLRPGGRTVIGDLEIAGAQRSLADAVADASLRRTHQLRYPTALGTYIILTALRPV